MNGNSRARSPHRTAFNRCRNERIGALGVEIRPASSAYSILISKKMLRLRIDHDKKPLRLTPSAEHISAVLKPVEAIRILVTIW